MRRAGLAVRRLMSLPMSLGNDRQNWIVAEFAAGRRPSNKDIQKANRCSRATATRDLKTLRRLGLIRSGQGRVGEPARARASPL